MYRIAHTIENDSAPSMVAEVSFHPSGSYFAVTYEDINEVRIYDSRTRKLFQVLSNPDSQLSGPHGVLFTEKFLLVSNTHSFKKPGTINVYRNSGNITKPIQLFESPFNHLREPHTLAMRDGRLVACYCENLAPSGAIVAYEFDDEMGKINRTLDKTESWFSGYGDSKGICFNADGTKVFVTFESDKPLTALDKIYLSFESVKGLPVFDKLMKLSHKAINKFGKNIFQNYQSFKKNSLEFENYDAYGRTQNKSKKSVELEDYEVCGRTQNKKPTKNGIAVFSISAEGKIAHSPEQVILRKKICCLENIDIFENTCVVTDLVNNSFSLYDLTQDIKLRKPAQTVDLGKAAPHGAKFSPDGRLLIISSLGKKIVNQAVQWRTWQTPREDKVFVFERTI
jgi:WD40 repeat protein